MDIPNFSGGKIVNPDGTPTAEFKQWQDQLILTLQQNAGTEGLTTSRLPSADISMIQGSDNKQNGTFIYDETTHEMKVTIAGIFKTIQVV